jgi:hypothetical protein
MQQNNKIAINAWIGFEAWSIRGGIKSRAGDPLGCMLFEINQ